MNNKKDIDITQWITNPSVCASCQLGKSCKQPFKALDKVLDFPLDKVHCDIWGPTPIASSQKFRFYVVFIDDHSRFKRKLDFFTCFVQFQRMVENQFNRKIKVFQCDGGGEFNSTIFLTYLQNCEIKQQLSCPGTPEQNRIVQHKHRHIVEIGLTLLFHANLSLHLWVDAFITALYLINRLPSTMLNNDCSYYRLYHQQPDYSGLWVFGCRCFPSLCHQNKYKFQQKTYPCIFIGYSSLHKGY